MSKAKVARRTVHPIVAAVVPPVVAAVVQPVAKRLARIEALLIEMRFEHDVQSKRVSALKAQLDALAERLSKQRTVGKRGQRRLRVAPGSLDRT